MRRQRLSYHQGILLALRPRRLALLQPPRPIVVNKYCRSVLAIVRSCAPRICAMRLLPPPIRPAACTEAASFHPRRRVFAPLEQSFLDRVGSHPTQGGIHESLPSPSHRCRIVLHFNVGVGSCYSYPPSASRRYGYRSNMSEIESSKVALERAAAPATRHFAQHDR